MGESADPLLSAGAVGQAPNVLTASYARVQVELGKKGLARVEQLVGNLPIGRLMEYVQGTLGVSESGRETTLNVKIPFDSGSGVTSISKALVAKVQQKSSKGEDIKLFGGVAGMRSSFGGTRAVRHCQLS